MPKPARLASVARHLLLVGACAFAVGTALGISVGRLATEFDEGVLDDRIARREDRDPGAAAAQPFERNRSLERGLADDVVVVAARTDREPQALHATAAPAPSAQPAMMRADDLPAYPADAGHVRDLGPTSPIDSKGPANIAGKDGDTSAESGAIARADDDAHADRAPTAPNRVALAGGFDEPALTSVTGSPTGTPYADIGIRHAALLGGLDQVGLAPDGAPATTDPGRATRVVEVKSGDTLISILGRAGVSGDEADSVVASLSERFDPRRIRPGQSFDLTFEPVEGSDDDGVQLAELSLSVDALRDVRLVRDDSGVFEAHTVERELRRKRAFAGGTIDGSLYDTAIGGGMPRSTLAEMIKIFSWDIDFQRDIQRGDGFRAVFDTLRDEHGELVQGAEVLYAEITTGNRTLTAYRFEREDGTIDYLDANGAPVRKWLMRTPVDGARLSSSFGPRRHPILGYTRMHKGIDFAAPTGTPVYAAGDGIVDFAGRNKGYGNYLRIRHNGEWQTAYAHLHKFAKGMRKGTRVRQGQIIGYVGSTGMSTGPHLHYEVHQNNNAINPLKIPKIVLDPLKGPELARFQRERDRLDQQRHALMRETTRTTRVASSD